jgi:hypothetical protein
MNTMIQTSTRSLYPAKCVILNSSRSPAEALGGLFQALIQIRTPSLPRIVACLSTPHTTLYTAGHPHSIQTREMMEQIGQTPLPISQHRRRHISQLKYKDCRWMVQRHPPATLKLSILIPHTGLRPNVHQSRVSS